MSKRKTPMDELLPRLEAAGISFEHEPTQFHHQRHGQLGDTFLVFNEGNRRKRLRTDVEWSYRTSDNYLARGVEAAISKWSGTSIRKFVAGPLFVTRSDFSGYGVGLMITEGSPSKDDEYDLVAVLPALRP